MKTVVEGYHPSLRCPNYSFGDKPEVRVLSHQYLDALFAVSLLCDPVSTTFSEISVSTNLISNAVDILSKFVNRSTREHALFFLYGTGANGKSVFLSTVSGLDRKSSL